MCSWIPGLAVTGQAPLSHRLLSCKVGRRACVYVTGGHRVKHVPVKGWWVRPGWRGPPHAWLHSCPLKASTPRSARPFPALSLSALPNLTYNERWGSQWSDKDQASWNAHIPPGSYKATLDATEGREGLASMVQGSGWEMNREERPGCLVRETKDTPIHREPGTQCAGSKDQHHIPRDGYEWGQDPWPGLRGSRQMSSAPQASGCW